MWEDGRFVHTRCFTRDVTDQKLAEKARRSQQRQLQLVSDSVPALISYVDDQFRYRFCNRAYSQWFGLPHDEIVGRTMCEVLGAEAWTSFRPHIEAALAGRSEDFELEAHYARGGTRWIHAVYSPDRDPDGSVRGVIVLVTDITAYKRQEHQVAEQARLLNQTNDAIIVRDPQNRIIYWNRGAEELYGYSTAEALGRVKYDLLRTEFPQSLDVILEELHREGRWSGELVHTRKDGERLNVLARWALDHDADGRPGAILETTNDITARKRAEVRERELTERMYAATAKFESVFNQSGIFAGVMDLDGNLREVNDLALNACGYRREEAIDRPFWETPWWRGSEDVKARIRAGTDLARSGTAFREVLPYWWADGTEHVVDFAMNPIRDHAGTVRFLNPTGIDITDRIRAEQALRDGRSAQGRVPGDAWPTSCATRSPRSATPCRSSWPRDRPTLCSQRSRQTIDRQVQDHGPAAR